jgi:chondroitin 4-sulfotransferase 11
MGFDNEIKPLWKHKVSNTDAAAVYFKQLTKEHVRKLRDKFKLDLELFGYSAKRYYDLATSIT